MRCVKRVMELACGVALVLVIGSSAGAADEEPLMGPRPVYATTSLVTDGNANCVIIFADGEGYEDLAQKIAAKIQAKTGWAATFAAWRQPGQASGRCSPSLPQRACTCWMIS